MDGESPRLRLSILGVVVLSLFGALFARLWYLQVMTATQYQVATNTNIVREIRSEAPRGRILDRWGQVIVDNRTSLVVTVSPNGLLKSGRKDDVVLRLSEALTNAGVPTKVSSIQERIDDPEYDPLQDIPVAIDVPEDFQVWLLERSDDFPAVDVKRESVRVYPHGSTAAHVLGYVGRISPTELELKQGTKEDPKIIPKPYEPNSDIGKTGVEKMYEDDLRGTPGVCRVEVDARNFPVRTISCTDPIPGDDVVLTIDLNLQTTVEQTLALQLLSRRDKTQTDKTGTYPLRAPAGSSVVMDPRNGQVFAMASFPTYDPSEFVNGISADAFARLRDDPNHPLTNRATQGQYAPGSTFKLITATAALSQGLINGGSTIVDNGSYDLGDRVLTNAGGSAYGALQVPRALTVSSDVFFYTLGGRYQKERAQWGDGIQTTARLFGVGSQTGIPLSGESSGLVLTPEDRHKQHVERPDIYDDWVPGNTVQLAIGQNVVLMTPLQLADAYATFSQKGTRYQPQVVDKVLKSGGSILDQSTWRRVVQPAVAAQFTMPDSVFNPVFQGLAGVADPAQGGTAGEVFSGWDLKKWPIVSKTGTAQVQGKADTSLFVGYGPALDPKFVAVAVLEESGFGADAAAPVVKRVFETVAPEAAPKPPPPPPGTQPAATPAGPAPAPGTPTTPTPAPEATQGVVPSTGRGGP